MTITYILAITKLETENYSSFSNVAVQVNWDYTGTNENGISGTCNGRTILTFDSIDPITFVPYDQLSEDLVKVWVNNSMDDQTSLYYREFAEAQVLYTINQKIKDLREQPSLPWAPTPESSTL
jgi:hypothetical protein